MVVKESAVLFIFINMVIKIIIQIVNHVIDIIIFRIPLPQEVWDGKNTTHTTRDFPIHEYYVWKKGGCITFKKRFP